MKRQFVFAKNLEHNPREKSPNVEKCLDVG